MGSPSDFAPAEIEFNKLDDLPNKGNGKPHTAAEIMKAMKVLHQMVHKQAEKYGGKDSKLLAAGIAEGTLFQRINAIVTEYEQS
jgi:hypothetical protein